MARKMVKAAFMMFGVALLLVPVLAWVVEAALAKEVIPIIPHAEEVRKLEKAIWTKGDPVATVYGVRSSDSLLVVLPDKNNLIVPEEDPSLLLLTVDKQKGENPLQMKTVWFIAKWLTIGLLFGLLISGSLLALGKRRHANAHPVVF